MREEMGGCEDAKVRLHMSCDGGRGSQQIITVITVSNSALRLAYIPPPPGLQRAGQALGRVV